MGWVACLLVYLVAGWSHFVWNRREARTLAGVDWWAYLWVCVVGWLPATLCRALR